MAELRHIDKALFLFSLKPNIGKAMGERLHLLRRGKPRQQKGVASGDFVFLEALGCCRDEVGQLEALEHKRNALARLRGQLLSRVPGRVKAHQRKKALRFLVGVNVGADEVFDYLSLKRLSVGELADSNGYGFDLGKPR